NTDIIGGTAPRQEKARQLMTKIVNNLSAKMEMGSPMVCMYLLGNPDHYKSHQFATFFWQGYVSEARKAWEANDIAAPPDKVTLLKCKGSIVGLSPVFDYIYRPVELSSMCLYDWIRRCRREKLSRKELERRLAEVQGESTDGDKESDNSYRVEKGLYALLNGHPLSESHGIRCMSEETALVPNFVGAMLPPPIKVIENTMHQLC
ncbi:hypothetical protein BD779DRAFT_1444286, partial [Infundibulicybe gibba]